MALFDFCVERTGYITCAFGARRYYLVQYRIEVFMSCGLAPTVVTTMLTACYPVADHHVLYCSECTVYPVAAGFASN